MSNHAQRQTLWSESSRCRQGKNQEGVTRRKNINSSVIENLYFQCVSGIPFTMPQSAPVALIKTRSCHDGTSGKPIPTWKSYRVKRRMSREHQIRCWEFRFDWRGGGEKKAHYLPNLQKELHSWLLCLNVSTSCSLGQHWSKQKESKSIPELLLEDYPYQQLGHQLLSTENAIMDENTDHGNPLPPQVVTLCIGL